MMQIVKKVYQFFSGIAENFYLKHRYRVYEKIYLEKSKITGISVANKREGEDEYLKKWKKISIFVSPTAYRFYSQFIGNNPSIVPELVLRKVIEPFFHPAQYQQFYNDKNMYDKLLPKEYLAKSLFRCIEGVFCDENYMPLTNVDDRLMLEMCKDYDKVIVKPTHNTGHGNSILLFERKNGVFAPLGHKEPFSLQFFTKYYNENFVIQECMKQSSITAFFNSSSVNTFRVFTYKSVKTNEVHVLGIVFRMGKTNEYVDNCDAGGTFIGVSHDGRFLNPCVFDHNGKKYSTFNGIDFTKEHIIPNMQDVVAFSKTIGESIYHNRTLDLDVMLDENDKPRLIEYNVDACTAWLYQFATGPVFGEFTDEVIDYVKSMKSKK